MSAATASASMAEHEARPSSSVGEPAPPSKIKSLQILRFLAAAMVVGLHTGQFMSGGETRWFSNGAAGVDIFFVLSGFVIYNSILRRPTTPAAFLRARVIRIVPAYYVTTALWIILCVLLGEEFDGPKAISSFFFLSPLGIGAPEPYMVPAWSLSFELLFYSGAAILLASRRCWPLLVLAYAAVLVLNAATGWQALRFLGNPLAAEFFLGIAIAARWYPDRGEYKFLRIAGAFAAALYLAFFAPSLTQLDLVYSEPAFAARRAIAWGLPSAVIVAGALAAEPYIRGAWSRWTVYLGDASYTIYLLHWPLLLLLLRLAQTIGPPIPAAFMIPAGIMLAIGGSVLAYALIEQPLKKRFRERPQTRARLPAR